MDPARRFALRATIASRLVVWAAALGALACFGANASVTSSLDNPQLTHPFAWPALNFILAPTARFDAVWYLGIAQHGYGSAQSTAFYPLYPLLVRVGGEVTGSRLIFAVLLSLAAMLGSLQLLYRLTRLEVGEAAARWAVLLLAFFPAALFLSAVYTESLYLCLTVGAVYAARRERWAWAGILAGLSSATRAAGVLVFVPLVMIYLEGRRTAARGRLPRFRLDRSMAWLALVPVGLLAYMAFLWITKGSPMVGFHAEQYWGREFAGPFGAAVRGLVRLPGAVQRVLSGTQTPFGTTPLGWEAYQVIDVPFLGFGLAGLWFAARRLPLPYFAYALLALGYCLSYPTQIEPMESLSRYLVVIFPLFMGWGAAVAQRRWARRITLGVLGAGLVGLSGLWGIWAWVA